MMHCPHCRTCLAEYEDRGLSRFVCPHCDFDCSLGELVDFLAKRLQQELARAVDSDAAATRRIIARNLLRWLVGSG